MGGFINTIKEWIYGLMPHGKEGELLSLSVLGVLNLIICNILSFVTSILLIKVFKMYMKHP